MLGSGRSYAAAKCTQTEAITAESVVGYIDSWDNVYLFFKQFGHCYDASIAEGLNDKIQLLWANHWQDLPRMLQLTAQNHNFKTFMWQRIHDEDYPANEFAKTFNYAKTACPHGGASFCRAFIRAAAEFRP
jgi:hypothetical protein